MKILLAEDDQNIIRIAQMVLEKVGHHQVETAIDGGEALQKALSHSYDLIILDGMMPVHPGLEVCRLYKEQKQQGQAKIIFLSAKSSRADVNDFLAAGDGYIQKPFDARFLCSLIDDILKKAS